MSLYCCVIFPKYLTANPRHNGSQSSTTCKPKYPKLIRAIKCSTYCRRIMAPHSSPQKSLPATSQPPASSVVNEYPSSAIPRSRSVQFSTSDAPMSRSVSPRSNFHQRQQQAESSADEITPIVSRERGGAKNKRYDSTSTGQLAEPSEPGPSRRRSSSSATRRRGGRSGLGSQGRETAADEGKDGGSWWRDLAEKYGSVELENKGSVARDHLALGVSTTSPFARRLSYCSYCGLGTRLVVP